MDAVEYLNQVKRICSGFERCSNCPLYYESGSSGCKADLGIYASDDFDIGALVEKVEKWAKEHPVKTRATKLLEAFPNADVYDGISDICPKRLETSYRVKCCEVQCEDCEREYWAEEIE